MNIILTQYILEETYRVVLCIKYYQNNQKLQPKGELPPATRPPNPRDKPQMLGRSERHTDIILSMEKPIQSKNI